MYRYKNWTPRGKWIYWAVLIIMKVRMKRDVIVEVVKTRIEETWDKPLYRHDELNVETIDARGKYSNLTLYDGDVVLLVPVDAYEVIA
jgi:hypothetical protein